METIALNEDVGIKNIREFYRNLAKVLKGEDEVILDFSRVKRIDLSLAQVLMAAGRIAKSEKKILKLKNVSADIKKCLQIAGLMR